MGAVIAALAAGPPPDAPASPCKYKLTYFNYPGIAEPIRFILAYIGESFEDVRLQWDERWEKELKQKYPWGKLPVLSTSTGFQLSQSIAICRYLARQHGLIGSNEIEAARCDELVDTIGELREHWVRMFVETDQRKKTAFMDELMLKQADYYFKLTKILNENGRGKPIGSDEPVYLVGNQLTWADLYLCYYLQFFEIDLKGTLPVFPLLEKFKARIEALPAIKNYMERRPRLRWDQHNITDHRTARDTPEAA